MIFYHLKSEFIRFNHDIVYINGKNLLLLSRLHKTMMIVLLIAIKWITKRESL